MAEKTISIIIPVYKSANTIALLVKKLLHETGLGIIEIILINDASPDKTGEICKELVINYKGLVKMVDLARNFGEHNAVMAGLNYCRGDLIVIMDDDFQNPPSEIQNLVKKMFSENYDVVYGEYIQKKHHWFRNLGSRFNGFVATMALGKPRNLYLSSFKILNRFVVNEIISYRLPFPYIDGLIFRITDRIGSVKVTHTSRLEGESNYTFWKLIRLWLNMVTNFTIIPLHFATILGILTLAFGLTISLFLLYWMIIGIDLPSGWASIIGIVTIFSGVQLISIGIIGEYIGRLFLGHNGTPQFIIRETVVYKKEI
jgi:glycosyltransferase involved in cell wall biosynthesis